MLPIIYPPRASWQFSVCCDHPRFLPWVTRNLGPSSSPFPSWRLAYCYVTTVIAILPLDVTKQFPCTKTSLLHSAFS